MQIWKRVISIGKHVSSNSFECTTSASDAGVVEVRVSINGQDYVSSGFNYTFIPPRIIKLDPTFGPVHGGIRVLVSGSGFRDTDTIKCRVGNSSGSDTVFKSSSLMECRVPPSNNGAGVATLEVSMDGETYSKSHLQFVYIDAPYLESISPQNGPANGETMVTIRGDKFSSISDLTCQFGDSALVNAIFVNEKIIRCMTPGGGLSASVRVKVSNHKDQFVMGNFLNFRYEESIDVSKVSPTRGAICGGTVVTILGNNFLESKHLKCKFGNEIVRASFVSENMITCVTPGHAVGEVSIFVSNNNHNYVDSNFTFIFSSNVIVSKVSPAFGSTNGGTTVEVSGENFLDTGNLKCKFGSSKPSFAYYKSPSLITCVTPVRAVGKTKVLISLNGKDFIETSKVFAFTYPPMIEKISPISLPEMKETLLTVYGNGFIDVPTIVCRFGTKVTKGVWVSASKIECHSPKMLPGKAHFEISLNSEDFTNSETSLTFVEKFHVEQVKPSRGLFYGGTEVTLNGNGFTNSSELRCLFDISRNIFSVKAVFVAKTEVTCVTPRVAANNAGSNALISIQLNTLTVSNSVNFVYDDPIIVNEILPTAGGRNGGTVVRLLGKGLPICRL